MLILTFLFLSIFIYLLFLKLDVHDDLTLTVKFINFTLQSVHTFYSLKIIHILYPKLFLKIAFDLYFERYLINIKIKPFLKIQIKELLTLKLYKKFKFKFLIVKYKFLIDLSQMSSTTQNFNSKYE